MPAFGIALSIKMRVPLWIINEVSSWLLVFAHCHIISSSAFYSRRVNITTTMSVMNWLPANVNYKSSWMTFGRRCGISKTPSLTKKKNWYYFHTYLNYSSPAVPYFILFSWRLIFSVSPAWKRKKYCRIQIVASSPFDVGFLSRVRRADIGKNEQQETHNNGNNAFSRFRQFMDETLTSH